MSRSRLRSASFAQAYEAPGGESHSGHDEERAQGEGKAHPERSGQAAPPRGRRPHPSHQLGQKPEEREHGRIEQHHQHAADEKRHRSSKVDSRVDHSGRACQHQGKVAPENPALPSPAAGWQGLR